MKRRNALPDITAFPRFDGNSCVMISSPRQITDGSRFPIPCWRECVACKESDRSRAFDFYRIELNDRSILAAAERENLTQRSLPLLRLYSDSRNGSHGPAQQHSGQLADTLIPCDESEEQRVQRISRRILADSSAFPAGSGPILQ